MLAPPAERRSLFDVVQQTARIGSGKATEGVRTHDSDNVIGTLADQRQGALHELHLLEV